jgi:hypothetical protein
MLRMDGGDGLAKKDKRTEGNARSLPAGVRRAGGGCVVAEKRTSFSAVPKDKMVTHAMSGWEN